MPICLTPAVRLLQESTIYTEHSSFGMGLPSDSKVGSHPYIPMGNHPYISMGNIDYLSIEVLMRHAI